MAAKQDYIIEQGATFQLDFTWVDSNGAPVNITAYDVRMQIRPAKDSDTLTVDLTIANGGITITDGAAGKFTILLTATETTALDADFEGVYDVEAESPAGFVTRLAEGLISVSGEVTR